MAVIGGAAAQGSEIGLENADPGKEFPDPDTLALCRLTFAAVEEQRLPDSRFHGFR